MKYGILSFLFFSIAVTAFADGGCFIVGESGLPYTRQSWFYSGAGNDLQGDKIKARWDEGYRITAASHTSNGWFVVMSQGSNIGMQTYQYTAEWPGDWMTERWNEGYQVTQVACGKGKWLIVMSKGSGITSQVTCFDTGSGVRTFIQKQWDADYRITAATAFEGKWYVVMSKNSGIGAQTYRFRDSYAEFRDEVKKLWDEHYLLSLVETDGRGGYFFVMSKFTDGRSAAQSYNADPSDVSAAIDTHWNNNRNISYIGGMGYVTEQAPAVARDDRAAKTTVADQANGDKYYYFDMGTLGNMHMWQHPDGSCTITQNMRCYACQGSLKCNICFGTGNGYAAIGRYMACVACGGTGRCATCQGNGFTSFTKTWQPGEAEAYLQAHQEVKNEYRRQSSAHERRERDYVESIYYRPNYTGKPYPDEYCSKCGKWMQPHSHIKKTY